jgi:hypothetical protein
MKSKDVAMDEREFRELVQRCHNEASNNMNRKCELLKSEIQKLLRSDAIDFGILFDTMMIRAYSHSVWSAPPTSFMVVVAMIHSGRIGVRMIFPCYSPGSLPSSCRNVRLSGLNAAIPSQRDPNGRRSKTDALSY